MNSLRVDKNNIDKIINELKERNEVLPATSDIVFKNLFRDESMKSILALLISNITGINEEYIYKNITYEDSYIGKNTIIHKDNTVDLHVKIEDNTIMLEMNESNNTYTRFNNVTHFHSGIVDKFLVSKNYENIGILYQINFDNNHPFSDELISRIMMRDDNGKLDEEERYFRKYKVNLSFFSEKGYNIEKLSKFERVLLIMREKNKDKLKKLAGKDKELKNMVKKIEDMSEARKIFDIYAFNEHVEKLARDAEKQEARKEGLAEGRAEGRAQGRAEAEKETKIETARKMLKKNIKLEDIIDITGLSKEEIQKIEEN